MTTLTLHSNIFLRCPNGEVIEEATSANNFENPIFKSNERIALRPYQKECLESITSQSALGCKRQLIVLPTASGKTIIFVHLIKEFWEVGKKVLVFVHTTELINQTKEKISRIAPEIDVGIVNGDRKDFNKDVVVCSIQSARVEKNLKELKKRDFQLLVADEAHHFATDSSRSILNSLGFGKGTNRLLIGFTATPFRNDKKGLGEIFEEITYEKTTKELIDAGYLVPPVGKKILTSVDLSEIKQNGNDFQIEHLVSVINTPEINETIINCYKKEGEGRKALCFGITVAHSYALANLFQFNGIASEVIHGKMPKSERERVLKDFKEGRIQVLCNCQVLTEGFDEESIECIIVARPTRSKGLYIQIVGRGLRLHKGKKDCVVLDFCDRQHTLYNTEVLTKDKDENINAKDLEHIEEREEVLSTIPESLHQNLKSKVIPFDLLEKSSTKEQLHPLKDPNANWRSRPVSMEQRNYIKDLGHSENIEHLMRGEASDLIGYLLRKSG